MSAAPTSAVMMDDSREAARSDAATRLIGGASLEVGATHERAIAALADNFPPGTLTYITHLPHQPSEVTLAAAKRARAAGFEPVPHIAARSVGSVAEVADLIAGLVQEAGVTQVLAVGGDVDDAAGPFTSVSDLMRSELLQRHGIASVGFAGHPEEHPVVARDVLEKAMVEKVALARQAGMAPFVTTQFCFRTKPIVDYLARLRQLGIDAPVAVGLAGPAELKTLATFALRCGVGRSARVLRRQGGLFGRLIGHQGSDRIVTDLVRAAGQHPNLARLHVFPFGGIARAGAWRKDLLDRLEGV